ncbi:MAG: type 1 glutamine amidotransferase, partial [Thermodesulfobacteriota bacterium]
YGENAYGLQFHLEVTEEMISEWVETYGEENGGAQASPFSKAQVLTETEIKIESYTRTGMKFLENFFRQ